MPSDLKSETARANGAKSHGPNTPEGRARSSRNAIKHGLNSRRLVLSCESPAEFKKLHDSYHQEFQPHSRLETQLVDQLVADQWRLCRIASIETELLDLEAFHQEEDIQKEFTLIPETARTALAFRSLADKSRSISVLYRHEGRLRRNYNRTLELLTSLRQEKNCQNEPKPL